ncbi:bifunctional folylpolyglutamate synthase/dihydrofolate synthase [Campylobacter sp. RM9760]|uniref:Bifunctional folylpolyglutamate synthase/dihydrofolate synthase n=1 Tax=Campylobacter molothri TaxID=1032242 RepID=A0ACC5W1L5_9BACT|nr:Mur ligase family protein [Campylobacter sp. RM10537]MBZ7928687.1 bifunctional folylpolyglutamate synthase/dihydrofolate synthase [Campylobacter sp. RM10542]MBZ7949870.1 bifunctional folylpolyglutamate synthase/dihydrofolate synthase [Campylobacter sp. RM10534]MBZ7958530.1 bifunctional folylpolyglutamate synthase/dihydrofolate synthase [Campylobacter sp. RM9760]MBZ7974822.1 bifunctional folylpolyglutamate synthase/dihydrofolate synthase [Campylobacter sp. RM9754]
MKKMIQNKVSDFLAKKNLCYDRIDRFLMFRMYEKYKNQLLAKPIIQIIGTNGKGSTGRFLAQLLENIGYNVGHYTSPHIFDFKERFYKNKGIVCKEELEQTHEKLEKIFKEELNKLSYFEYATFLAAVLFRKCDYVIFEAGLGGEYDATSVFEKKMSIFTKIGFDHMQILGDSLEKIARTKLKVMSEKTLISSEQEEIVLKIAKKIANLKKVELIFSSKFEGKYKSLIQNYVQKYNLPLYLKHNLILALNAFEILASKEKIEPALAKLEKLSLKGRLEQLEPNLYIDVGHNVMAATALRDQFMGEKLILVYNSYQDKDVFKILKTLKPIIDTIKIYKYISIERKLMSDEIYNIANILGIKCEEFSFLEKQKKTLVFGSFALVENFLKEWSDKK